MRCAHPDTLVHPVRTTCPLPGASGNQDALSALPLGGFGLRHSYHSSDDIHRKQPPVSDSWCASSGQQLLDFKAATELSTTKRLLNMLIFNAVENGAVTTVCAALNLAFYLTRPLDYIHLCLYVF